MCACSNVSRAPQDKCSTTGFTYDSHPQRMLKPLITTNIYLALKEHLVTSLSDEIVTRLYILRVFGKETSPFIIEH